MPKVLDPALVGAYCGPMTTTTENTPTAAHDCADSYVNDDGRCDDCDRRVGGARLVLIEAGLVAY